jgi:hypothetical protein
MLSAGNTGIVQHVGHGYPWGLVLDVTFKEIIIMDPENWTTG